MDGRNQTGVSGFILLGLSSDPGMQLLLFVVFLGLYLVTVLGNLLIVLAVGSDPRLHSPMYFFLANLSLVDVGATSATIPRMLADLWTRSPTISYAGCLAQLYFFLLFTDLENFLLTVMAYDRFVAICRPLHYWTVMSLRRCGLLLATCWVTTHLYALAHTVLVDRLPFCASRRIAHFYCDLNPILRLSCARPWANQAVLRYWGGVLISLPPLLILGSYAGIVAAVLRVPSAGGKRRAFSTCGSHLAVVSLFYGTVIAVYLFPSGPDSAEKARIAAAALYTAVTPLLNPFIYSLRNSDLHRALRSLGPRRTSSIQ
ncbi:olfactory receptor 1N1-like [Ornithorhynchus anatinus]|uniref:olfactory receptor 1N1-like n=1 Tax=Ornithorhynchus anatinus TaxID=9258 RepID=UPI0010A7D2DA|nr:olfactory receptor 1N1-like [Ornithorhynchus anatinus]